MAWTLYTDELDEGPVERVFGTKDAAVGYAVIWFCGGYDYEENDTMRPHDAEGVADYVLDMIECLRNDRPFFCSRFGERARISETTP